MHYRNGRPANNGDKIVRLETHSGKIVACGQLQNAVPGNDYCNGQLVITGESNYGPAIIHRCLPVPTACTSMTWLTSWPPAASTSGRSK